MFDRRRALPLPATTRLSVATHADLRARAESDGVSVAEILRRALACYLAGPPAEAGVTERPEARRERPFARRGTLQIARAKRRKEEGDTEREKMQRLGVEYWNSRPSERVGMLPAGNDKETMK